MMQLWLAIAALLVLAMVFVFWPLRKSVFSAAGAKDEELRARRSLNVELYKQRQQELKSQLDQGDISEEQMTSLQAEMDAELVAAAQSDTDSPVNPKRNGRFVFLWAAACMSIFVFAFYDYNGASTDIELTAEIKAKYQADRAAMAAGERPSPTLARKLMASLEAQLEKDPENVQYRYLLARNATDLQDYPTAITAYKQILEVDESPLVMGDLAQLLFVVSGNTVTPEMEMLISKTLEKDPNSHVALGLDGIRNFQTEQYQAAITQWEKAIGLLGPRSAGAQSLAAGVLKARGLLAEQTKLTGKLGDSTAATVAENTTETAKAKPDGASGEAGLRVKVSLASGVSLNPEHTVFIYARAWQGMPMPLAIKRLQVKDLPVEVTLTEAMAMAPGMSITSFEKLELVARVSAAGSAMSKPGDWQASKGPISNSTADSVTSLVISSQL